MLSKEYWQKVKSRHSDSSAEITELASEQTCRYCKFVLPLDEFYDGSKHRCKMCNSLLNHNITRRDYVEMLAQQGGRCKICRTDVPGGKGIQRADVIRFAVDHDHACCPGVRTCGKCIRGLLCNSCNFLIGQAGDDVVILAAAIKYLLREV